MRILRLAVLALAAIVFIILFAVIRTTESRFDQASYFKDADPANRVFVFVALAPITTEEVETHAKGLMNTPGRFTAAYYFDQGAAPSNADPVTLAPDYVSAMNKMFTEAARGWRWRYVMGPQGQTEFIDCGADAPSDDLCKW